MIRTRIKICGLRDVPSAIAAVQAGVDAVGLVFVAKSPRCVTMENAAAIIAALPPFVLPIALFADAPTERVISVTTELGIRDIQLHGHETISYANYLSPMRVIKAFAFEQNIGNTLGPWVEQCTNLSGILIDTPPVNSDNNGSSTDDKNHHTNAHDNHHSPERRSLTGGSGITFNWSDLATHMQNNQANWPAMILAGGLTPKNVGEAIAIVKPYAVDVSSGVESSRGVKSIDKIHAFCKAAQCR